MEWSHKVSLSALPLPLRKSCLTFNLLMTVSLMKCSFYCLFQNFSHCFYIVFTLCLVAKEIVVPNSSAALRFATICQ
eukprot:m.12331 g.12331  ORF g.12331 m.12331 type:complete len:77 (+) comp23984_c0_seq3:717-947(+)